MKPASLLLGMLAFISVQAQQADSISKQKSQFRISVNYNSRLNYYGRTDSLQSSGVFPLAELWFTKDLYINAAPVFVNNSLETMNYAGTVTTVGYMHVAKKWISHIYLLKPFYERSSGLVQSALKAQSGASLSFLNKPVNMTAGGDVKLSDKIDYGVMAGADHVFRKQLKNRIVLVVDPSVYAYAGTQNFTRTYYKKQNGFLLFPGSVEEVNEEVQQFSILANEFSLPVILAKDKWMLMITPAYVMPHNLIKGSEEGANMFYGAVTIKLRV